MTTLRFVGDLSPTLGVTLALIVGVFSWRLYQREDLPLSSRVRWGLPLLRSAAFALGVLLLTGPVLHHRITIGELGRVQIYVDGSQSMTRRDPHMSLARKLRIAESLGWSSAGVAGWDALRPIEELTDARRSLAAAIEKQGADETSDAFVRESVANYVERLQSVNKTLTEGRAKQKSRELLDSAERVRTEEAADRDALRSMLAASASFESEVFTKFHEGLEQRLAAGEESITAAVSLFDDAPRWRRTRTALEGSPAGILTVIRENHDVTVRTLVGTTALLDNLPQPDDAPVGTPPIRPEDFSPQTDLSTGVIAGQKRVTDSNATPQQEEPPARSQTAVVLITDGRHNDGPSPLQTARVLGGQGVAVYAVSVGASQSAPDFAVTGIDVPEFVFAKDRVRGAVTIQDRMPAGTPFVVTVSTNLAGTDREVLWDQELQSQDVGERLIEFEFDIEQLTERLAKELSDDVQRSLIPLELTAAVTPHAREFVTDNNSQSTRLAAILQSRKVLILDGRPRWETRYLRNAFERDEQWDVTTVIAGDGTDDPTLPRGNGDDRFPRDRESLFEFDLVIFGEISPSLFSSAEFQWLRDFVGLRGGGLVFVDGQRGVFKELTEETLLNLIPVNWVDQEIASRPTGLRLTEAGARETSLRLRADESANRDLWAGLRPPHRVVPVAALPGAEVLAEVTWEGGDREDTLPAVVTRPFGAGRVLYLSHDETWRLRYHVADLWHQRLWNQLARLAMPEPFAVSDEYVSLDTGPVRRAVDDQIDIRVRLLDLEGRPREDGTVDVLLRRDDRVTSTIRLTAAADVPGLYRGRSEPLPAGEYESSVRAAGYGSDAMRAQTRFVVEPADTGEMTTTSADESLLRDIAAASGGAFLREEEIGRLPDLLAPLSSGRVVESETPIWQSYWWFTAMLALLTAEWVLRKRAGLL